jgi:prevent-host-death family protein
LLFLDMMPIMYMMETGRRVVGTPRHKGGVMDRLNVVELRHSLADILNRAEYQGERIIIHRRGKDAAAIISIADLKLLERLIEEAEDRLDIEAARTALAESDARIPYAEVRRRLGLADEQEARRSRTQAGTETV